MGILAVDLSIRVLELEVPEDVKEMARRIIRGEDRETLQIISERGVLPSVDLEERIKGYFPALQQPAVVEEE